jgi:hypothetical protein
MSQSDLQEIADAVIRRAERQGFVTPDEVREELTRAGHPESLWKDVLALARPSVTYRQGRYEFVSSVSARAQEEQHQQQRIREAVQQLIGRHRAAGPVERREEGRVDFIHPVRVRTEDGREFTLLSRDLSPTGIRLIGTRRLLGQKVRVLVPGPESLGGDQPPAGRPLGFVVRILWTCALGDDLFENGGMFLEALPEGAEGEKDGAAG